MQLSLLQTNQPALIFEPTKGGQLARCGFTQELFGGIFSPAEAADLLLHFAGRTTPIAPSEFGAAAAQVVRYVGKGVRR